MYTYECILKYGHMGAGNDVERSVRVRADSILEAMRRAQKLPGVKKGRSSQGGSQVLRVALLH
jgi:hypothetical protein